MEKFERDRNSQAAQAAIQQDIDLGNSLGIQGTPFLILNGEIFNKAIDLPTLEKAIASLK